MSPAPAAPALPDLDRAQLAAFNRNGKLRLTLARLTQRTAAEGRVALYGRLGLLRVLVRQGEPDAAGAVTWDVELVEP